MLMIGARPRARVRASVSVRTGGDQGRANGRFTSDNTSSRYSFEAVFVMSFDDYKVLIPATAASVDNVPALLGPDLDRAADLARQEKASATRRAYRSDFDIFQHWTSARGV